MIAHQIIPGSLTISITERRVIRLGGHLAVGGKKRRQRLNRCATRLVNVWKSLGIGKNFTVDLKKGEVKLMAVGREVLPGCSADLEVKIKGLDIPLRPI